MTDEIESRAGRRQHPRRGGRYLPPLPPKAQNPRLCREKGLAPLADDPSSRRRKTAIPIDMALSLSTRKKAWTHQRTLLPGRLTSLRKPCPTTRVFASGCALSPWRRGSLLSRRDKDADSVYTQYYEYREPVRQNRGPPGTGHRPRRARGLFKGIGRAFDAHTALNIVCSVASTGAVPLHGGGRAGRRGRLRPPDFPRHRARDPRRTDRTGRRAGDQGVLA